MQFTEQIQGAQEDTSDAGLLPTAPSRGPAIVPIWVWGIVKPASSRGVLEYGAVVSSQTHSAAIVDAECVALGVPMALVLIEVCIVPAVGFEYPVRT